MNGQPLDDIRSLIQDVARRPRRGVPIRFGMSVIARETDAEAQRKLVELFTIADQDKPARARVVANADPDAQMFKRAAKEARVERTEGPPRGSSVAMTRGAPLEFNNIGVELFMLQFQPVDENMRRFAEHVIPRVRHLQARAA
ncbi:alkanesulfonate monooxygenase SsuD/methylene tetrahydromethanopterin reductase-like flavin-dependent oxidoreductase (luciferase family) [Bradyrhizobium sp. USDA 3311]